MHKHAAIHCGTYSEREKRNYIFEFYLGFKKVKTGKYNAKFLKLRLTFSLFAESKSDLDT